MSETNWMWDSITRSQDTYSDDDEYGYDVLYKRDSWSVTRHRTSNEEIDSQLGEYAETLTAFNGATSRTITNEGGSTATGLKFDVETGWTARQFLWIYADADLNGYPIYQLWNDGDDDYTNDYVNRPDSSSMNFLCVVRDSAATSYGRWMCVEADDGSAVLSIYDDNDVTNYIAAGDWVNIFNPETSALPQTPEGEYFDEEHGTFTGAATAGTIKSQSTSSREFYCSSDTPTFTTIGVDWYKQTQTWVYKNTYEAAT